MKVAEFYQHIYDILGDKTPLATDCGKLCDSACCEVSDAGEGMYLFPKEERLVAKYLKKGSFKLYPTGFVLDSGRCLYLYSCNGTCKREHRPLSCRIFPLVPFKLPGRALQIILDPRGAHGLCPLAEGSLSQLDPNFVTAVKKAMAFAVKNNEVRSYIEAQTEEILLPMLQKSL